MKKFICLSEIQPNCLAHLCAVAFSPVLMLYAQSHLKDTCAQGPAPNPHCHGDSKESQPTPRDCRVGALTPMYSVEVFLGDGCLLCYIRAPARVPDLGLLCVLSLGGAFLLLSKNGCGIPRHMTSQSIKLNFAVRCFLVLVSHTTWFTFSPHLGTTVSSGLGYLHAVACGPFGLSWVERALCPYPAGYPCE